MNFRVSNALQVGVSSTLIVWHWVGSLAMPEQVEALINYVVSDVPVDSDDKKKFMYPFKSSEVCPPPISQTHEDLALPVEPTSDTAR